MDINEKLKEIDAEKEAESKSAMMDALTSSKKPVVKENVEIVSDNGVIKDRIKDYTIFFGPEMKVLKEEQEKATEICENIAKKVQSVQGEMKGGLSAYAELITAQVEASKNRIGIADQIVKLKKTMLDYNFKDKNGSAGNGEAEDIKQILLQINNNNSNGGTPKTPQEAFVITEDNENK